MSSYRDLPDSPLLGRGLQTLSVIIAAKNEERNLPPLIERLFSALRGIGRPFEAIVVNDGSTDGSLRVLRDLVASHRELRVIDLARNYGQTSAMMAGFSHAPGNIIVPIDADLQNDPADIALLLTKLEEGYDFVSGWRKERQDATIRRNLVSRTANGIISRLSGVHLRDDGPGVPVVTTTIAANGLGASSGEQLLVADTDDESIDQAVKLLCDSHYSAGLPVLGEFS